MQKRRETFLFFSVNQHSTWAALTVSCKASGSIQQELLFCFKDPLTVFFQLLTGTIWQKSVNTAATKVLKSIKDISSAKSRNFTDISRGQLRAPTIQTSVKFCYLSLQSKISSIPLDFSPLNLVRFLILKRSFQSQNYNISVIYFGGSHLVVLNENYKRKEVRKFDKKCRLLNCQ